MGYERRRMWCYGIDGGEMGPRRLRGRQPRRLALSQATIFRNAGTPRKRRLGWGLWDQQIIVVYHSHKPIILKRRNFSFLNVSRFSNILIFPMEFKKTPADHRFSSQRSCIMKLFTTSRQSMGPGRMEPVKLFGGQFAVKSSKYFDHSCATRENTVDYFF